MRQFVCRGIVLHRSNFGEADRIVRIITADYGKLSIMAKGVRKSQSKLAGGIEFFIITKLSILKGRKDIDTLMSAKPEKFFSGIIKNLNNTKAAYHMIKMIDKNTESSAESAYFELLATGLRALDTNPEQPELIKLWFDMQLLKISGHEPNLFSDVTGAKLRASATYDFKYEGMHFVPKLDLKGFYSARHIKFLRIGFSAADPAGLARIQGGLKLAQATQPLIHSMLQSYLRY